ncbi:hypothetical protein GUITHDRAFT_146625 [Guillardia theta CCMP2712]|uniref:Uncharacterized protein n=1 Tax=Guillardia theta (strain CCMP2712) TaxID=905079 RepID=L1IHB3_GUITC|nr:hypothetical protein GUITHDRAFT_146625 [Guillardia theta CCMP2712]EKX35215.1 hypothetical protein GUITHDRAFT_146625 [Guillardia theta CCMP2712]|eukprot:XP_005822195.1 hypothetical protein GUITHDRAFT_146625 [Guillardia theta CCMP2712]
MPSDIEEEEEGIATPTDPPPPQGDVGEHVKSALANLFDKFHVAPTRGQSVPVNDPEEPSDSDEEERQGDDKVFKRTAASCDVNGSKDQGLFEIGKEAGNTPKTTMSSRSPDNHVSSSSAEAKTVTEESTRSPLSEHTASEGKSAEEPPAVLAPEFPTVSGAGAAADAAAEGIKEGKMESLSPEQVDTQLPKAPKEEEKKRRTSETRRMSDGVSPAEKIESVSETVGGNLREGHQKPRVVLAAAPPAAGVGGGTIKKSENKEEERIFAPGQGGSSPSSLFQPNVEDRKLERRSSSGQLKGVLKQPSVDLEKAAVETAAPSGMRSFLLGLTAGLLFAMALAALIVAIVAFRRV